MDEMDHIQDMATLAQEALLAGRRRRAEAEAAARPPPSRLCRSCECEIPAGRLAARPTALLCVDCQADAEAPRR